MERGTMFILSKFDFETEANLILVTRQVCTHSWEVLRSEMKGASKLFEAAS